MGARNIRGFSAQLEGVRRRFEQWRETRGGRARIPDSLWASAARLAGRYGISRTAIALRVNSSRLKRHLERRAAAVSDESETNAAAGFVELTPFASGGSCECLLELEDVGGAKMRVQLKGIAVPDLAAISQSFWTRRS
jgi:hypothetical protein